MDSFYMQSIFPTLSLILYFKITTERQKEKKRIRKEKKERKKEKDTLTVFR